MGQEPASSGMVPSLGIGSDARSVMENISRTIVEPEEKLDQSLLLVVGKTMPGSREA